VAAPSPVDPPTILEPLLYNLRVQGLGVGLGEWLALLDGLKAGLARDLDGLYELGRSLLVHSESHYDAYDLAFHATFAGVALEPALKEAMEAWLADPEAFEQGRELGQHDFKSLEELMEAFRKTLEEQRERHSGGNRWIGTGGTSPFGNSGRANQGLRVGEGQQRGGGGRGGGVRLAEERRWQNYRTDQRLGVRDFKVALRALRKLAREGPEALDLDETIARTGRNGGEIDLIYRRERANRVRVVLLMDAGGSMDPHTRLVSQLFTAARETKAFKTFDHYFFHNCVYGWLYRDYENLDRVKTEAVLRALTPQHRLIFVGDAAMAPWELFSGAGDFGGPGHSGLQWLTRFSQKCPAAIWLNPDPERFWHHPTVTAIRNTVKMYPLTIEGLNGGIRHLRAPR
jgi:uncharacterized protein with von Willebrand factor type A (vWA) domain